MDQEPTNSANEAQPVFRKIKKKPKPIRSLKPEDGEVEDDEDVTTRIEDIREVQKVRERKHGLNALECALGKEMAREFDELVDDPFKMRGGGMLKLSDDKKAALNAAEIEQGIKEQFKKETLLRDEHEEMRKYIDAHLKRQAEKDEDEADSKKFKGETLEDQILYKAAEKLKGYSSKSYDELLSNQMLEGIPEVDLGINVRMENIIETEKKKSEILYGKDGQIDFAQFLDILHAEEIKGDPLIEVIRAFKGLDPQNKGVIPATELVNLLTSFGEKMSRDEVLAILKRMNVQSNDRVPIAKIMQYISAPM